MFKKCPDLWDICIVNSLSEWLIQNYPSDFELRVVINKLKIENFSNKPSNTVMPFDNYLWNGVPLIMLVIFVEINANPSK